METKSMKKFERSKMRKKAVIAGLAALLVVATGVGYYFIGGSKFSADSNSSGEDFFLTNLDISPSGINNHNTINKVAYGSQLSTATPFKQMGKGFDLSNNYWDARSSTNPSVVIDSKGNFFVTARSEIVNKYDSSGNFVTSYALEIDRENYPSAGNIQGTLVVGPDDSIYLSAKSFYPPPYSEDYVEKLDNNLTFVKLLEGPTACTFGNSVTGKFTLSSSAADTVDGYGIFKNGNTAQIKKSYSKVCNPAGVTTFGKKGTANGDFTNPYSLAVDSQKNIYVFDSGSIKKYDLNNNFLQKWGSAGTGDSQFKSSNVEMAYDPAGFIYTLDESRIQKFDLSGKFILSYNLDITPRGIYARNGNLVAWTGSVIEKVDDSGKVATKIDSLSIENAEDEVGYPVWDMFTDNNNYVNMLDARQQLTKFDVNGNFISKTHYEDVKGDSIYTSYVPLSNGNLFSFRQYSKYYDSEEPILTPKMNEAGNRFVHLSVYDNTGKIIKRGVPKGTETLGIVDDLQFLRPVADSKNNVYVPVSYKSSQAATEPDTYIFKFDSNGEYVRNWKIGQGWMGDQSNLLVLKDDNILLTSQSGGSTRRTNSFYKFDGDGKLLATAAAPAYTIHDKVGIQENKTGDIVLIKTSGDQSTYALFHNLVYKFDKTLKQVSTYNIGDTSNWFNCVLVSGASGNSPVPIAPATPTPAAPATPPTTMPANVSPIKDVSTEVVLQDNKPVLNVTLDNVPANIGDVTVFAASLPSKKIKLTRVNKTSNTFSAPVYTVSDAGVQNHLVMKPDDLIRIEIKLSDIVTFQKSIQMPAQYYTGTAAPAPGTPAAPAPTTPAPAATPTTPTTTPAPVASEPALNWIGRLDASVSGNYLNVTFGCTEKNAKITVTAVNGNYDYRTVTLNKVSTRKFRTKLVKDNYRGSSRIIRRLNALVINKTKPNSVTVTITAKLDGKTDTQTITKTISLNR